MVIYKTTNSINGKIYIGQEHKYKKYYLGSGTYIKRAIEKYGKGNFKKEILQKCLLKEYANDYESYWIKKLNSKVPYGYNLTDGGEGALNPAEETRQKMSLAKKGIIPWNKGKTNVYSDETRRRMGDSQRGKPGWNRGKKRPEISGKNNPMYGKKRPDVSERMKLIRGKKHPLYGIGFMAGKKHSEETKKKISEAITGEKNPFYGKKHSVENRKKMSEGLRGHIPWNKGLTKETDERVRKCGLNESKTKREKTRKKINQCA